MNKLTPEQEKRALAVLRLSQLTAAGRLIAEIDAIEAREPQMLVLWQEEMGADYQRAGQWPDWQARALFWAYQRTGLLASKRPIDVLGEPEGAEKVRAALQAYAGGAFG